MRLCLGRKCQKRILFEVPYINHLVTRPSLQAFRHVHFFGRSKIKALKALEQRAPVRGL